MTCFQRKYRSRNGSDAKTIDIGSSDVCVKPDVACGNHLLKK